MVWLLYSVVLSWCVVVLVVVVVVLVVVLVVAEGEDSDDFALASKCFRAKGKKHVKAGPLGNRATWGPLRVLKYVFFKAVCFFRLSLAVGLGWWFGCSL